MRSSIKMTHLANHVAKINKLGSAVGFGVYIMITGNHLTLHRNDGELIFKVYARDDVNMAKAKGNLWRFYEELWHFLHCPNEPFRLCGPRKLKPRYYIYFNF